jgi:hypothetical protein
MIGTFSPAGEPISQHRLRRNAFVVVYYDFMRHFLAATATLVRE